MFEIYLLKVIDFVGQVLMQIPQEKQSGLILSLLNMLFIALEGQAAAHSLQFIHVVEFTLILNLLNFSTVHPKRPKGQNR